MRGGKQKGEGTTHSTNAAHRAEIYGMFQLGRPLEGRNRLGGKRLMCMVDASLGISCFSFREHPSAERSTRSALVLASNQYGRVSLVTATPEADTASRSSMKASDASLPAQAAGAVDVRGAASEAELDLATNILSSFPE
eukprot:scaffold6299_cov134-Pinguiococcus_pyrenoidosus.AAC.1